MRPLLPLIIGLLLSACEGTFGPRTAEGEPQPITDRDCGVFGQGSVGDISGGYGEVVSGSTSGRGGGVLVRNAYVLGPDGDIRPCPLNVYHRSPNGSGVCSGEWCPAEPPKDPAEELSDKLDVIIQQLSEGDDS